MDKDKILIADDQPEICNLLESSLKERGYRTTTAFDGEEALRLLLAVQFDLLVTDLVMPKRDGLALIRDARGIDPELEVIILTGYGSLDNAIEALRLGAFDYLQKPIDLKLFVHTVERALERRRLRLANRNLIAELRSAKERLEQQRAIELERIEQIGRALATNLQREQIVELLQQALLVNEDYGCEAVALLAWNNQGAYGNLAVRSRHRLASPVLENLRNRMLQLADDAGAPAQTQPLPETNLGTSDKFRDEAEITTPLVGCDSERLPVQGTPMGVLAAFAGQEGALSLECRRVFHILAGQAAVALDSIALFEQVRDLAHRDGLTRLYNHLYFMDLLESEVRRARRYRRAVSLLFIDIDHFKQVNDRFGHQAGDQVLMRLARIFESCVRDTDLVGRYGGEEFVVLLPESSEREGTALAERLRSAVEAHAFDVEADHAHITLSIGVASFFPEQVGTGDDLVRAADEALMRAKGAGRNCVYSHLFNQVVRLDPSKHDVTGHGPSQ
jgi:diguanylate cyclase (GGDEF)-like protein